MNYRNLPNGDTIGSTDELPAMLEDEEGFPPYAFVSDFEGRRGW